MSKKLVELIIEDLAFDGKSVAHLEGKVVFLNAGLPGETVRAEITRVKSRYCQGIVHEIVIKANTRIPAICTHAEQCGGCTWQDLLYAEQLRYKKKQVVESIARIGGLDGALVNDVIPSTEQFAYRNKMEFSFHTTPEGGFTLGLHSRGRFDEIFDLDTCYLQSPIASRIVDHVRRFVTSYDLPVYDVLTNQGYVRFLTIRDTKRTGQLMVNLVTNYGPLPHRDEFVTDLMEAFPAITTIVHCENGRKSNIATAERETVLSGPGFILEQLLGLTFRISANSFFQTNSLQAETLYRAGFGLLHPQPDDTVLDLYCGTGTIGLMLASQVKSVTGVELVPDAVARARENAGINAIDNVDFVEANAAEYLKDLTPETLPFSVVVIDPPRAGLHPKALKRLLKLLPGRILYISCNPATFARDAGTMVGAGYGMSEVTPVDMFPHTKHIEVVACFRLQETCARSLNNPNSPN